MSGLLTDEVKTSLEEIIKQCFYNNRIADRIMSILNVQFVMTNTEKLLHKGYAHVMPILADVVTDYMSDRDSTAIYGETPRGDQEYDTPLECFRKILEINLDLESLTRNSIKIASDTGDYTTMITMQDFLKKLIPITADLLTLVDKAENYESLAIPSSWMDFDKDILAFGIFGD